MSSENEKGRNLIRWISGKDSRDTHRKSIEGSIMPLDAEQKKKFPNVIYELESRFPQDHALMLASFQAMTNAGYSLAIDLEKNKTELKAIVRTSISERRDQIAESAIFLGLTEATRRKMETPVDEKGALVVPDINEYREKASGTAKDLLYGMTSKPELFDSFKEFYSGLRWSTQQEKLVNALFIQGADFDPDFIQKHLNSSHLSSVADKLNLDISYEESGKWNKMPTESIFKSHPELDYRRLEDEEFRKTEEGQNMLRSYTEVCGEIKAQQNKKKGFDLNLTKEGQVIPRPLIPLSKHPIIEALIVDELSLDRPRRKYDFGAYNFTEIALDSDSQPAHDALVTSINTRLPKEQRNVFDGPSEFEHKHRNIRSIIGAYEEEFNDEKRRGMLKQDLLKIMDAFTGEGEIAESVRIENAEYRERSKGWGERVYDSRDVNIVKDITRDLIVTGLTAPDPEIVEKTEDLIERFVPENDNGVRKIDPLELTKSELIPVVFDAVDSVSAGSNTEALDRTTNKIIGDRIPDIGKQFRKIADERIRAHEICNTPEYLLALREVRYINVFDEKLTANEKAKRERMNELRKPADELTKDHREVKNRILLDLLEQLSEPGVLGNLDGAKYLFKELVRRVKFGESKNSELPGEYHALMNLAKKPELPVSQRNDIFWQLQSQFEYVDSEKVNYLVPVVLDMYESALGPADEVRLPEKDTHFGLSAASQIVSRHGQNMFKKASRDQIRTLASYGKGLQEQADRIAAGAMHSNGEIDKSVDLNEQQKEKLENLGWVMRDLQRIGEYFKDFLRIEEVKVKPHVYYPWMLEQFVPFWQGMQWEVGPGNRPTSDMRNLYNALENQLKQMELKHAFRKEEEYTAAFDAINEGHVDTLLGVCYEKMVKIHDLGYNNTVWQKGLPFVSHAIAMMPPVLVEQIITRHAGTDFANYIEKEYERWNKDEKKNSDHKQIGDNKKLLDK